MKQPMTLGVTAVMLSELGFEEQVSLCAELGVTHYVYRPREIAEHQRSQPYSNWGNHKFDLTPRRLLEEGPALSARLKDAGLTPFGTVPVLAVDADDDTHRLHYEGAAAGEATAVRVQPAGYPKGIFDYEHYLSQQREHYERAIDLAQPYGVKPVIEMHAHSAAAGPGLAMRIVELFDPTQVGLILDLPNAAREGFIQPNLAVSSIRRYLDHVHIGGCRKFDAGYDELGFRRTEDRFCALTESDLHIPTWLAMLDEAGFEGPLVIEDYTDGPSGAQRLRENATALKDLMAAMCKVETA